jgi:hypothetical protein
LALVVGRAFGGSVVQGVTTQLQPPASLGGAPDVPAPSVPHVQVPSASAPQVPSASAPSAPGVPSASVPGAASGAASGATGSAAAASGSHLSAGAAAAATGSRSSASGGGVSAARAQTPAERRHRRAAKEASLRRDVNRYSGCLDDLPGLEGRVLALRAGMGDADPASRRQTARRLGISTRRAAALERSGLRNLRSEGSAGGCASAGSGVATALGSAPQLQPAVLLGSSPALTSPDRLGGKHRHGSRGGSSTGSSTTTKAGRAPKGSANLIRAAGSSSKTAGYIVGLLVLALVLAMLIVSWLRRHRSSPARLLEQTGSAAVWRPWTHEEPDAPGETGTATAEPPPERAESWIDPAAAAAAAAATGEADTKPDAVEEQPAWAWPDREQGGVEPLPAWPDPEHRNHRQRRPFAVVAASILSLGATALLRRGRRRR